MTTEVERLVMSTGPAQRRVLTVEHDHGWGWIARDPRTGRGIPDDDFRWSSRSIARAVVRECREKNGAFRH